MGRIGTDNMNDSVESHLHTDIVTLQEDMTAAEALVALRRTKMGDKITYLYVQDTDGRLLGVVPVRRLLGSEPDASIKSIMVSRVVSIPATSTVLDACEVLLKERFLAVPIVDSDDRLRGVIDLSQFADEVLTSTQQQMDSAFQMVGVHVAWGRRLSPLKSFRMRFPWLMCNITSGIICAFIASRFELLLSKVVLLAMFLTVVLALGESVSMQSMTITLQGLVGRQAGWRQILLSARREFTTSVLLAAACGTVAALAAYILRRHGMGAAAGHFLRCHCVHSWRGNSHDHPQAEIDRRSAGPIVLASADIATLIFYFTLASWLLA